MTDHRRKLLDEFRLTMPVLVVWCLLFLLAIYFTTIPGSGRWAASSMCFLISTSSIGIWMLFAWLFFYRKATLLRFALSILFVVVVTQLGMAIYKAMVGKLYGDAYAILAQPLIISFCTVVIIGFVRSRLGWRFVTDNDTVEATQSKFTMRSWLLLFIACVIMICGIITATLSASLSKAIGPFIVLGIALLPTFGGVLLLAIMSRFSIRVVWLLALLSAFLLSATTWLMISSMQPIRSNPFWLFLAGHIYAVCFLLVAATYLRSRGMLFRCGGMSGFAAPRPEAERNIVDSK